MTLCGTDEQPTVRLRLLALRAPGLVFRAQTSTSSLCSGTEIE